MKAAAVQILWDASHIWGLMALRAMRSFGIPCRLISAKDIAQGCLFRKPPRILIIPGGNARQKAVSLGEAGRAAILAWISDGGAYIGFCGGAGLALSQPNPHDGLGLCPWRRKPYPDRLAHLLSGPILADTPRGSMSLPVWWPGRFEQGSEDLAILARYSAPQADTWLADRPFARSGRPECAQEAASLEQDASFPFGQPLIIAGHYGSGAYILSYAHLETPASEAANSWLAEILAGFGANPTRAVTAEWRTMASDLTGHAFFQSAWLRLREMLKPSRNPGLFFPRTSWLLGWKQGLPGIICNSLLADLLELAENGNLEKDAELEASFEAFFDRARIWLAEYSRHELTGQLAKGRDQIFGHPMLGGGRAGRLLDRLEELILQNQQASGL